MQNITKERKDKTYMNIAIISQVNYRISRHSSGLNGFMWEFHTREIDKFVF